MYFTCQVTLNSYFDSTYIGSNVVLRRNVMDDDRDAERRDEANAVTQQLQHSAKSKVGPVAANIAPPQAPLTQSKGLKLYTCKEYEVQLSPKTNIYVSE